MGWFKVQALQSVVLFSPENHGAVQDKQKKRTALQCIGMEMAGVRRSPQHPAEIMEITKLCSAAVLQCEQGLKEW